MDKRTREDTEKAQKATKGGCRRVDFQIATVTNEQSNNLYGYFSPYLNTITVNKIEGNEAFNEVSHTAETVIHELKHRDNFLQGFYDYPVSPEQALKRNIHDEISANICELVSLRQRYIETGEVSVFDNTKFEFYKEAIKKGEIDPDSNNPADFEKDMRLIVNGTQKMWFEKYEAGYIGQTIDSTLMNGDFDGKYAKYWDENYKKSLKTAYNIGGVDFTKYMDKDLEIKGEDLYKELIEDFFANADSDVIKKLQEINPLISDDTIKEIVGNREESKALDWLKGDISANKDVKNEKVNFRNKSEPEYPKSSEDEQVSEVKYGRIIDMRTPIIKQPGQEESLEQQQQSVNQSKKSTASKMKDDYAKAKVAADQSNLNKSSVKNKMREDAQNEQKLAKVEKKSPSKKQVQNNLYYKGCER